MRVGAIEPSVQDLGAAVQEWTGEMHGRVAEQGVSSNSRDSRRWGNSRFTPAPCGGRCSMWCKMPWRLCRRGDPDTGMRPDHHGGTAAGGR